jgi:Fanconi anemia group M protein
MKEKQVLLKLEGKIVIACDYRERETINLLEKIGATVNKTNLEVGDFVCSQRIVIEKKTHSDFISSIIDGRIFDQVKNMKGNFEKPIVLIEGYSTREINENALRAALASLIVDYGISLINTRNPLDTAKTIYWIAKREQQEMKREVAFKVGKKPEDEKKLKEFIISGIPGISTVLSKRLLEHFESVEKIFIASEDELKSVSGIGEKLAKKIRKVLTEKY